MRKLIDSCRNAHEALTEDLEASGVTRKQLGQSVYGHLHVTDASQRVTNILNGNTGNPLKADQAIRFAKTFNHSFYYLSFVLAELQECLKPEQAKIFLISAVQDLKDKLTEEQKAEVASVINTALGFISPTKSDGTQGHIENERTKLIKDISHASTWISDATKRLYKIEETLRPEIVKKDTE